MQTVHNLLALDVGDKRIGVALVEAGLRVPRSLTTLNNDEHIWQKLKQLVKDHQIERFIIGLPRGLQGQTTGQTKSVEAFADTLTSQLGLPLEFQDEALTSHQAERGFQQAGKGHDKGDIDAVAAMLIMNDYLEARGL